MMTVVYKARRLGRWESLGIGRMPPSWAPCPHDDPRGSAKPGRGGRRKRRRRARERNPAADALRALLATTGRRWFVLPPGATLHMLEARPLLGRRERRRRAKLRRRRARRERALVRTLKAVGMWGQNRISRLVTSGADQTVKLYGVTRTPGA